MNNNRPQTSIHTCWALFLVGFGAKMLPQTSFVMDTLRSTFVWVVVCACVICLALGKSPTEQPQGEFISVVCGVSV